MLLDGKPIQTPARAKLVLSSEALALAIAVEWDGQGEEVIATAMPLLRPRNSPVSQFDAPAFTPAACA